MEDIWASYITRSKLDTKGDRCRTFFICSAAIARLYSELMSNYNGCIQHVTFSQSTAISEIPPVVLALARACR